MALEFLHGACHCGRIEVEFQTASSPGELALRECQCSFCRRHGARTVSDPNGRAIVSAREDALGRYRFGLATADFLICRFCGVYVGAVVEDEDEPRAVINAAGTRLPGLYDRPGEPVSYEQEAVSERLARRRAAWTPIRILQQAAETPLQDG